MKMRRRITGVPGVPYGSNNLSLTNKLSISNFVLIKMSVIHGDRMLSRLKPQHLASPGSAAFRNYNSVGNSYDWCALPGKNVDSLMFSFATIPNCAPKTSYNTFFTRNRKDQ